jgi:hypothetical protein
MNIIKIIQNITPTVKEPEVYTITEQEKQIYEAQHHLIKAIK